jgi:hypothetical protein
MFTLCATKHAAGAEPSPLVRVTLRDDSGQTIAVDGRIVVEAADGGFLLMGRDGQLWSVTPKKLVRRESTGRDFSRYTPVEQARALADELGSHFELLRTRHYVIATSTGHPYAEWCGDLFERLLDAFLAHWRAEGLELSEPAWPLPVIIFADEREFKTYASAEAGHFGETSKGYYSVRTNRIILYDLTAGKGKKKAPSLAEIKKRTAAAVFNVATIVHEATHQIAFNSGMHTRYADNPLWLTEGMATYFETPDLDGGQGWKTVGQVNRMRFNLFLDFARRRRKKDSLSTLITQAERFSDSRKAADAYSEAWALTYFLYEKHREPYVRYLKHVAQKPPLIFGESSARLAEFKSAFGDDLAALDKEFLAFMKSLPKR